MEEKIEYSNNEITVIWKPKLCQHYCICIDMLPQVYNPEEKPWIKPENATKEQLIAQIDRCPSGALTYRLKNSQFKNP